MIKYPPPFVKKINQRLILTGIFSVFLFLYSCRKDKPENSVQSQSSFVKEARSFFEEQVLPTMPNNLGPEGKKTPLWDQAKMVKINLGDAVVVPIKYDRAIMVGVNGENTKNPLEKSSYLLIYKDVNHQMQGEWVVQTPMGKKVSDKFVGIISINEWNGKNIRSFLYKENGDIVRLKEMGTEPIYQK